MAANNCEDVAPLPPNFTTFRAPKIKSGNPIVEGGGYPKVMESPRATMLSFGFDVYSVFAKTIVAVICVQDQHEH